MVQFDQTRFQFLVARGDAKKEEGERSQLSSDFAEVLLGQICPRNEWDA